MNIAQWLYRTALKTPDAPALFEGAVCRTNYRQFAERAGAIGEALKRDYSVRPGDRVALFLKNRTEYLEILYGAWWVGAAVVPINARLHVQEAAWIVENAETRVLFTDDGNLRRDIPIIKSCTEIAVDGPRFLAMKDATGSLAPPQSLSPGALGWLFYTSGTTGRPKGVMLSHENLIAMSTTYTVDVDNVSAQDACLYVAPLSHGAGLYNFIHVRQGARHVVPASRGFSEPEIFELAAELGALSFFAAPTMVNRLVKAAKLSGFNGDGIKSIICGGAPMYVADFENALDVLGPKFIQIYGQGESPMTITALQRDLIADKHHTHWRNRLCTVGTPHSCVEVRVVDQDMIDLPAGEAGEVIVRGATVMQGYWHNEQATQETIIDGWLKTGDIGKFDESGFLTLTDRSKDVIISGGTNIYPREVEEVLMRCPDIKEVAVIGIPNADWGESVVAFVVMESGATCNLQSLDTWCRNEMAAFKRPKKYQFINALPKNAYGKVLKTELRRMLQ